MATRTILLASPPGPRSGELEGALAGPGLSVLRAATCEGAMEVLERARPHLAVLHRGLGGLHPLELSAMMRLAAGADAAPVIYIDRSPSMEEPARRMGAAAFLTEPVEPVDLRAIAMDLLKRREADPLPTDNARTGIPPLADLGTCGREPTEDLTFRPSELPSLLLELHRRRFHGHVEINAGGRRVVVSFTAGAPAAVEGLAHVGCLGALLLQRGVLNHRELAAAVDRAARQGMPLARYLATQEAMAAGELEAVFAEQVLMQVLALRLLPEGRARLGGQRPALEAVTHPVHPAVAAWKLAGSRVPVPPIPEDRFELFVAASPGLVPAWRLLDPQEQAGSIRLLLQGGGRVGDILEIGRSRIAPLLALLEETGLVRLVESPPVGARRAASRARVSRALFMERLLAHHGVACDADPFTTLGLPPGAPPHLMEAAAEEALSRYAPTAHPLGLSPVGRAQAVSLYRSVARARRCREPARRDVVRAVMAGPPPPPSFPDPLPDHAILLAEEAGRLMDRRQPVAAAALLRLAIELEGDDPDLLLMLSRARREAAPTDPRAGEDELQRALVVEPRHIEAACELASLLGERGQAEEGQIILQRLLTVNPEAHLMWRELCRGSLDVVPTPQAPSGQSSAARRRP